MIKEIKLQSPQETYEGFYESLENEDKEEISSQFETLWFYYKGLFARLKEIVEEEEQ